MSRLSRFVGKTRHGQPQPAWRMPSIAIAAGIAAVAGFAGLAAQSKGKVKALPVPDSSNFSLSTQITKANVGQLEMAWFYPYAAPTFSPVFANDVLYGLGRNASALVALDPATGKEIWVHEGLNGITSKGINYWESADGKDRRLIFAVDSFLQEIDARTGKSIPAFGDERHRGHASRPAACRGHEHPRDAGQPGPHLAQHHDLRRPVGRVDHDAARRHPRLRRAHRQAALAVPHDPAPGRVRVRDQPARRLQVHGRREQLGRDVDRRGARHRLHPDRVSHRRLLRRRSPGQNLFANCLLALDVRTGKRLWHFQTVHHDLWDLDNVSAPQLVTVTHNGRKVDVVAHAGKTGFLYVFERVTGRPLWPIEERPVDKSEVPFEQSWPTQPFPTKPRGVRAAVVHGR